MSVAQLLRISYIELRSAEDTEFIEFRQQGKNHYREEFPEPLTVLGRLLSLLVHRKTWYSPFKPVIREFQIDVNDVLSNSPDQRSHTVRSKLDITVGLSPGCSSDVVPVQDNSTPLNTDNSRLITEQLPSQCLRFRILVIGQAGVGKSTLIQRAFGIEQASPSHARPGKTDIEKEFIPPQINRFILHDSQGFEAGIDYSDVLVKEFIVRRKMQQHVKDRLHAVWLCLSTPIEDSEDILLHCSVETFLKEHRSVLQNIPTVVVFTKYDKLLTNMEKQDKVDPDAAAKQYLQKQCFDPIARFAGDANLSYIAVSSSPGLAGR